MAMKNDMRDRLIELLFRVAEEKDCPQPHEVADYLIANGVIVPPCKVGDKIYVVDKITDTVKNQLVSKISFSEMGNMYLHFYGYTYSTELIGKTVFLTKNEAEVKLKECSKDA